VAGATARQRGKITMAVALVTGASTGIGLATAVALGRAGQDVYATMRKPAAAPELSGIAAAEKLPIKILPMDVDDGASVSKTVAEVLADAAASTCWLTTRVSRGAGRLKSFRWPIFGASWICNEAP